ncbi:9894_t:CDS:2 [Entrophospora sp. SA101]|nr:5000_t:CDS:2 [Entrophospora sp. SA101]CAJ0825602.1 9885_t:CDS:2 [Entrophospora sp. SA101]CAJ0825628.1 9894_t:CDS:2 [Entrophospora sp. SA101]
MVNSPLPTDLAGECKKASKILNSFIDPVAAKYLFYKYFHNVLLGLKMDVIAAGPVGRTAEGASSVSLGNVAAIFSYSKTKGLFAVSAKELLSGKIPPPPQADILYRALNAKASRSNSYGETQYNDEPVYGEEYEPPKLSRSVSLSTSASKNNSYQNRYSGSTSLSSSTYKDRLDNNKDDSNDDGDDNNSISSSSIKKKPSYSESNAKDVQRALSLSNEFNNRISSNSLNRKSSSKPPPIAPKPNIPPRKKQQTAVALYDFDGEQDGDLTFSKGDVIIITKQSESTNDWWTGKCKGKEGIFPANYVELN